ncbi:MAG: DUF6327 family protein [Capnocytophaga sp.]|nr:DUF6327 family protein [Capnocytophaga sp.]
MMITKNKKYQSFEEIETDLKILKLKKQIDMLYLKTNVSDLKQHFSVQNLVANAFSRVGFSLLSPRKRWFNLAIEAIYFLLKQRK